MVIELVKSSLISIETILTSVNYAMDCEEFFESAGTFIINHACFLDTTYGYSKMKLQPFKAKLEREFDLYQLLRSRHYQPMQMANSQFTYELEYFDRSRYLFQEFQLSFHYFQE